MIYNTIIIKFKGIIEDFDGYEQECEWNIPINSQELVKNLLIKFYQISGLEEKNYITSLHYEQQKWSQNIFQVGLYNNAEIKILKNDEESLSSRNKEALIIPNNTIDKNFKIFIKFIKSNKVSKFKYDLELKGLLKLCLLNEISSKLNDNNLEKIQFISQDLYFIMKILNQSKNSKRNINQPKKIIQNVLGERRGFNVLNFSYFVDMVVSSHDINQLMNSLNSKALDEIKDIKIRLGKYRDYVKRYENEYQQALRKSIFEFSVVSLVIIERNDFDKYVEESNKCSNREDKILYHGTQIHPISIILTGFFHRSINKCCQHGEGVYFTDSLDYCWFYGGDQDNRANRNKIPGIGQIFTAIASLVYYDKKKFLKVLGYDTRPRPGKNEINYAHAGSDLDTIDIPYSGQFFGDEYVVWDLDQICPLISLKFQRVEYCIIWRDINFANTAIYNNEFDPIFKGFLKDCIKYIRQDSKFNIYLCQSTKEAIDLVKKKIYNKIILISNVGNNYEGRKFVDEARKIIGKDVIALFLAYRPEHLYWIKNYKNALFCNDAILYKEYINCFNHSNPENKIKEFIIKCEDYYKDYKIKFNFDNNFLTFPSFKDRGAYSNLTL